MKFDYHLLIDTLSIIQLLMYGIIQIIATKGEILAQKGASSRQLVENALSMATRALEKTRGKGR